MVNFPTWIPDCDSHCPVLLGFFLLTQYLFYNYLPSIGKFWSCFCLSCLQLSFKLNRGCPILSCSLYDYSCADWDSLCDHLKDVTWEVSLNLVPLQLVLNFMCWSRLEFMYVSLIINIRSSLTHLYGFQLLVLMPQLIEITFCICTILKAKIKRPDFRKLSVMNL